MECKYRGECVGAQRAAERIRALEAERDSAVDALVAVHEYAHQLRHCRKTSRKRSHRCSANGLDLEELVAGAGWSQERLLAAVDGSLDKQCSHPGGSMSIMDDGDKRILECGECGAHLTIPHSPEGEVCGG